MSGGPAPLRPTVDDPDSAGFFEAAVGGRLALCECLRCERWVHLPLARCPDCARPTRWREVPGTGRVVSWTVVGHQVHPAFPAPYTVLLVELDHAPGVRLVGSAPGEAAVVDGAPVRVRFDDLGDGVVLPQWELVDVSASPRPDP